MDYGHSISFGKPIAQNYLLFKSRLYWGKMNKKCEQLRLNNPGHKESKV